MSRQARCHCGDLRLVCEGEPTKVSLCHCQDCQRRSGSAFSIAAFFPREAVTALGAWRAFTRDSASGKPVTFHFCPRCGANLYWTPERMPQLIGVAAGAFADPAFPAPQQSVWNRDRQAWVVLPDELPTFDRNPAPKAPAG
jgi:hypothetical protein